MLNRIGLVIALFLLACGHETIITAKAIDGAAQVGTVTGTTVIPMVDKQQRDAIIARTKVKLQAAKTDDEKKAAIDDAKKEESDWEQVLTIIKQAARTFDLAVTTAATTFALVVSGIRKDITVAQILMKLTEELTSLYHTFSAYGIDLKKLAGGN